MSLDGWMLPLEEEISSRVTAPLLFVNTEHFQWKENVQSMLRFGVSDDKEMRRVLITIRSEL